MKLVYSRCQPDTGTSGTTLHVSHIRHLHIKGSNQHTSMSVLYCVAGDVDPLPSTDDSTVLGSIVCIVDRYGEKLGDQKTMVRTSELILGELSCVSDGGREFTG